jgi:hypothetical protein
MALRTRSHQTVTRQPCGRTKNNNASGHTQRRQLLIVEHREGPLDRDNVAKKTPTHTININTLWGSYCEPQQPCRPKPTKSRILITEPPVNRKQTMHHQRTRYTNSEGMRTVTIAQIRLKSWEKKIILGRLQPSTYILGTRSNISKQLTSLVQRCLSR